MEEGGNGFRLHCQTGNSEKKEIESMTTLDKCHQRGMMAEELQVEKIEKGTRLLNVTGGRSLIIIIITKQEK